jgi:hypothetical protein
MNERKVEREPYTGEVIDLDKASTTNTTEIKPNGKVQATPSSGEPHLAATAFHNRPATRAGLY